MWRGCHTSRESLSDVVQLLLETTQKKWHVSNGQRLRMVTSPLTSFPTAFIAVIQTKKGAKLGIATPRILFEFFFFYWGVGDSVREV